MYVVLQCLLSLDIKRFILGSPYIWIYKVTDFQASPPREKSPSVNEMKKLEDSVEGPGESVTPPDGGWGWAVVFASFMIHIIGKSNRFYWRKYN